MNKIKSFYRKYLHNFLGVCGATAILINLIIETLARQTIYGGVVFLVQSPLVFLFNTLIIFACISIAMLFRHKVFAFCIISATWLGLGITNGVILRSRMTPLTTYDMLELKDGLSLATNYFSKSQIIGMIVGLVVVLLVIIILFRKAPKEKEKVNYKRALATLLLIGILTAGYGGLMIKTKVVDTYFPNLAYGYRDNGFVYCFLATWLDKGVSKPFGYSQEFIENIFTEEEREKTVPGRTGEEPKKHPNIIFLQLESFIDPQIAKDITLSKDAMPNYHRLAAEFSSGKLQVPSVGAGTANTEFETMTGMSVKFFGPGEYPYKSVLLEENCESIPFNLRQLGYSTH
ncbi:MAG: LTA synthase family protein, partial [Anaerovoracaceae bacterium]